MTQKYAGACISALLCLCLIGCAAVGEDYFSYRERGFCAEVEGVMRGVAFSAIVWMERVEGGYQVKVCYLLPLRLKGLTLSATCDDKGLPCGEARLSWEEGESCVDAAVVEGLLMPISVFLIDGEVATVRYEGKCCDLTLDDGTTLMLGEDGAPRRLQGEKIAMDVRWLEWSSYANLVKK